MRQLLSRLIGGGGLRQDNFVNAIGESAPIELAYLACRSLVTLVDLQSSENCAESTGSDLKWCHRPNTNLNMTTGHLRRMDVAKIFSIHAAGRWRREACQ